MEWFKKKYRVVKVYKDEKLDNIYAEYKCFFKWKRLTFNYCMATIDFSAGNLSFINSYENPHKYQTDEWWEKEEQEIYRLLDKWYVNYIPSKIKKIYGKSI